MLQSLVSIVRDKWLWREQVMRLGWFELLKRSKKSTLSWLWLIMQPLITIGCYWFALEFGLRRGAAVEPGMPPYILWLFSGVTPWMMMTGFLNKGANVFASQSYLVTKLSFPLAAIPGIHTVTALVPELLLLVITSIVYVGTGQPLDVHLLQIPFLLLLMIVFWDLTSLGFSILSSLDTGIAHFLTALHTPFFWLSGVIFNTHNFSIDWIRVALDLNPVTFFVRAFRDAFYYRTWIWEDPSACVGFAFVFALTLLWVVGTYKRFAKEVPDVL